MSRKNVSETPHNNYGPATGVPTPEPKNEALSKGEGHEYNGDVTPGTSTIAQPGHIAGGPGHRDCEHKE